MSCFSSSAFGRSLLLPSTRTWHETGGKKSWLMFSTASYYHDQTAGALSCSFGRFPLVTFTQWCWVTAKRGLNFASMSHRTLKTQFNNAAPNVRPHWWGLGRPASHHGGPSEALKSSFCRKILREFLVTAVFLKDCGVHFLKLRSSPCLLHPPCNCNKVGEVKSHRWNVCLCHFKTGAGALSDHIYWEIGQRFSQTYTIAFTPRQ